MKNKTAVFTIADDNNLKYAQQLEKSFRYFHKEDEADFFIFSGLDLGTALKQDPMFFYRATPALGKMFMLQGYENVVKIDADSLVLGNIAHTWEGEVDLGVVNNTSPRDLANAQAKGMNLTVWNIHPLSYVNCGFVVMKSKEFIEHWQGLCASPHFNFYQYREQDLLNILVFYGNYHVKFLDASDKWHGLICKGYEPKIELSGTNKNRQLVLKTNDEWPTDGTKQICVWHAGGGNDPNKMNIDTKFKPEVVKWLKTLTS